MRRILVDAARTRRSLMRGGAAPRVPFEKRLAISPAPDTDLMALDDALTELAEAEPRRCRVVEPRYFARLSVAESAEVLPCGWQAGSTSIAAASEWRW